MVPTYKYILTTLLASKAPTLGIGQVNFSSSFWVFRFCSYGYMLIFLLCQPILIFKSNLSPFFVKNHTSGSRNNYLGLVGSGFKPTLPILSQHKRKFIWCPTPFILYLWVCSQRQLAFWLPCSHTSKISLWPSKK